MTEKDWAIQFYDLLIASEHFLSFIFFTFLLYHFWAYLGRKSVNRQREMERLMIKREDRDLYLTTLYNALRSLRSGERIICCCSRLFRSAAYRDEMSATSSPYLSICVRRFSLFEIWRADKRPYLCVIGGHLLSSLVCAKEQRKWDAY